ncbi:MAG: SWIM zinc finger family protein [Bacillota bacterium]|nr:SWIM zinc finger family protein [Bacillota bacterium]
MAGENDKILVDLGLAESLTEAPLWKKGLDYFNKGAVGKIYSYAPGEFEAKVEGNGRFPYKCTIVIREGRLASHNCDCEAHRRYPGPCKHVIALLMKVAEEKGLPQKESLDFDFDQTGGDDFFDDLPIRKDD